MGERHIVPDRGSGGWKVIGPSTGATECHTECQADAIDEACAQLRRAGGGTVLIHGLTGRVQNRKTVAPEPRRHEAPRRHA
jgi:hypothetical protein